MNLRSRFFSLLVALVSLAMPQLAKATVIDFEDLSGSGSLSSNYAGLGWTNWAYYDSSQSPYNPSSGVERAYIPGESNAYINFGGQVTLNSLWMAGYNLGQTIAGYNNGSLVNSFTLGNDSSTFGSTFSLNWSIDELQFIGGYNNRFLIIDDLSYNGNAQGVPDTGATVAFLGMALVGFAALRRRTQG